ncbi:Heavy metal transport/detoxification protein [Nitratidesulfovibrio vulgaris RCH1]|nr:Heavy metal transport/detoxification protein [Nitratidesulfovibrio vulgaris DP4]ADP87299.1 Heavy metal transport/detoxification protein [Nitratidesulfovibrio vulgaris RCH1]
MPAPTSEAMTNPFQDSHIGVHGKIIIIRRNDMPTLNVQGMSCNHCKMSVTKALSDIPGVKDVDVSLEKAQASWTETASVDIEKVKDAIRRIGFDVA